MNFDIFAKWLRSQGHLVFQTESSSWVDAGPRIYQAFPYQRLITPSEDELKQFLQKQGAIALRYSTSLKAKTGLVSYHVTLDETEYRLEMLPKKARYDVRKGLKNAKIEPISFFRVADEGWQLRMETLQRQGREKAESQSWWQNLCQAAEGLPGFEAWAAIVDSQLAATLIAFCGDACCSVLYQQSRTQYLPQGVNNALTFVFTNEILRRPDRQWMFYGLHSLDAPPSVDKFKFRMGYTAMPVRQRVVFHPRLEKVFNPTLHKLLLIVKTCFPRNPNLGKAEGMLRFYLEGLKPLHEQNWPEPLIPQKESILRELYEKIATTEM